MHEMREIRDLAIATRGERALEVTFDTGERLRVDLSKAIAGSPVLAPLKDRKIFQAVEIGEDGAFLHWTDDAEIDAEALYRLGLEQAGETVSPDAFRAWRKARFRSQAKAAAALGVGERLVRYYESGERIVPRTVMLAMHGYDSLHAAE